VQDEAVFCSQALPQAPQWLKLLAVETYAPAQQVVPSRQGAFAPQLATQRASAQTRPSPQLAPFCRTSVWHEPAWQTFFWQGLSGCRQPPLV
jgi:hypothetical protein